MIQVVDNTFLLCSDAADTLIKVYKDLIKNE